MGEDGHLYLLDQVNDRILRFDPKDPNAEPHIFGLPEEVQPTDLVVRRNDILVWDGTIRTLEPVGPEQPSYRGLQETSTRAGDEPFAVSAFAQMGSQSPGSEAELLDANTRAAKSRQPRARARQYVSSRGAGSLVVDVIPERAEASAQIEVRRHGEMQAAPLARLRLRVADRLGAVEFLETDFSGRMFVFAENIPAGAGRTAAAAFVARFPPNGTLEGIYEMPLLNVALSRRFVTVSGGGDVFSCAPNVASPRWWDWFRAIPKGGVIDFRPQAASATPAALPARVRSQPCARLPDSGWSRPPLPSRRSNGD